MGAYKDEHGHSRAGTILGFLIPPIGIVQAKGEIADQVQLNNSIKQAQLDSANSDVSKNKAEEQSAIDQSTAAQSAADSQAIIKYIVIALFVLLIIGLLIWFLKSRSK